MSQEMSNNKLYVLLVVLSIAITVLGTGLYALVISGSFGGKSLNMALPPQKEDRTLSVSGSATASVIPDEASLSIGMLIQAATAREASEKNAAAMNAVISELKTLGLQDKDIRTSFLSIQPVYRYRDGEAPAIVGYSASNNVQVTVRMFERLGDIVDKSVASGANQVGGISFAVSEEKQKQIRNELLVNAAKDAEGKANKLAESLNVRIVGVKTSSISEGGFPVPFLQKAGVVELAATPIQPGESQVTLSVQVTYIIEQP